MVGAAVVNACGGIVVQGQLLTAPAAFAVVTIGILAPLLH